MEKELKKFAHDINNKLCVLKFRVQNLKNESDESEYEKKLSVEKMLSCITDISTLCKDLKEPPKEYDLNFVVQNSINSQSTFSKETKFSIKLKAMNCGLIVKCKLSEIDRILTNLFKNSQEAGSTKALIVLTNTSLYYYDDGPGFSNKTLDCINNGTDTYSTKSGSDRGIGTQSIKSICKNRNWKITFKNKTKYKGVNIVINFNKESK